MASNAVLGLGLVSEQVVVSHPARHSLGHFGDGVEFKLLITITDY